MKHAILLFSLFGAASSSLQAATINFAFHNGGTTVNAMTSRPDGTVVATGSDTWNNPARNGGVGLSFSGFSLIDSSGGATTATLGATAGASGFNTNGWGSQSQDHVMMEGWYSFEGAGERISINNLPAEFTSAGYTVTILGDLGTARTMNYTLGTTTQAIVDNGSTFNGTFSAENSTTFSGLSATGFTITGNITGGASGVNGIIIQSIPEPSSGLFNLLAAGLLFRRRR